MLMLNFEQEFCFIVFNIKPTHLYSLLQIAMPIPSLRSIIQIPVILLATLKKNTVYILSIYCMDHHLARVTLTLDLILVIVCV